MTDRYLLLLSAYAQRDRYTLMMFGLAAVLLLTDRFVAEPPILRKGFRALILLAWLGMIVYVFFFPGGIP